MPVSNDTLGLLALIAGIIALAAVSRRIHRAYRAALPMPGRWISGLERTRAYMANEEFLGDHGDLR